ncbi:MAG: asparagine synthase (glutamine-hydrolyzing) [Bacteroidetes bacterium]|jgi:asparagine synthase (glutamine-hydrolysing)|nr:asparagine synthase (glutamine-hydrolyzing) [Bacteroidota bacterium]
MCGISFLLSKNNVKNIEFLNFKKFNDAIIHRGPDDEGFSFINDNFEIKDVLKNENKFNTKFNILFGFRRLAILDLSIKGHQPMQFINRYCIVFNGEIYNYVELKKELSQKGYNFNTNTDTEVILASYDYWGINCFNKFNGMWAIIIYDNKKNEIIVSRDRYGIKPLYYYKDESLLLFGSEIKQFISYGDLNIMPNKKRILENFNSDTKEYTQTTDFINVLNFPVSSYSIIKPSEIFNQDIEHYLYYTLPNIDKKTEEFDEKKANSLAVEYFNLLKDSVRIRLRSDVPIGTCLSGGLDSSSIAYLINEILKESKQESKQNTFSLVFSDKDTKHCDESIYIDILQKRLDLNSFKIEPSAKDIIENYTKMIYHMDNIQHSTLMSYVFTYKLVKEKKVTVTLDGQGADELQAGYLPYLINFFTNIPIKNIYKEYKLYSKNNGSLSYIRYGIIFNLLKFIGAKKIILHLLKLFKIERNPYLTINEILKNDFTKNLRTLLFYGDRGSMMNSVESRFPFLDYRIVEFWMNLPECYKLHNGYTKYIARLAFTNKLPDEIVWRRDKMGWEIPQNEWIKYGLIKIMKDEIGNSKFIKKLGLNINLNNYNLNSKKSKYWRTPIKTFNIALWHKQFFK